MDIEYCGCYLQYVLSPFSNKIGALGISDELSYSRIENHQFCSSQFFAFHGKLSISSSLYDIIVFLSKLIAFLSMSLEMFHRQQVSLFIAIILFSLIFHRYGSQNLYLLLPIQSGEIVESGKIVRIYDKET